MNILIIGGTSGLGLEMARNFAQNGDKVIVTGRKYPAIDFAEFQSFDLAAPRLAQRCKELIDSSDRTDVLIYAAGYFQEGRITDLTNEQIEEMIDVGGRGLIYLVKALLERQNELDELITITSTSAWTPRQLEPIYNFAKAGAGHLTNGLAEDGRIAKVMQAGPAGMDTNFWKNTEGHDTSSMNKPEWVAEQIMKARDDEYRYKFIRILREPARVEEVEKR